MRLVLRLGGAEIDVDVSAAAAATVGQLAEALAGGPVVPGTGLIAGTRFIGADTTLAAAGLRQGASVRLATGPPSDQAPADPVVAELHVTGGVDAGRRVPLVHGSVVLGRAGEPGVDVGFGSDTVSGRHARLCLGAAGACTVEDLGSCNGTLVEGRYVTTPEPVVAGALVQLGAVQVHIVPVTVSTPSLSSSSSADRAAVGPPGAGSGTAPFNRPPRRRSPPGPAPVAVPAAPAEPAPAARFSWAMLLAPLVIGLAMAVMFAPVMAAFALFSPVMAVGTWWEDRRRVDRERRRTAAAVAAALAAFRTELAAAVTVEAGRLAAVLPDPAEALRRADGPSTRLWERRGDAADVLRLRLGVGDIAWERRVPPVGARVAGMMPVATEHPDRWRQQHGRPVLDDEPARGDLAGIG